jgi:hypothetical protein
MDVKHNWPYRTRRSGQEDFFHQSPLRACLVGAALLLFMVSTVA